LHFNDKQKDSQLSSLHVEEMEWILRLRDCAYQSVLSTPLLEIRHQDSLWEGCNELSPDEVKLSLQLRHNTTLLLELLRSQVPQCGKAATLSQLYQERTGKPFVKQGSTSPFRLTHPTLTNNGDISPLHLWMLPLAQAMAFLFLFVCFLGGRRRRR